MNVRTFGNDYRAAALSKLYLTVTGIAILIEIDMTTLNCPNQQ